jgi:hypothetical protein
MGQWPKPLAGLEADVRKWLSSLGFLVGYAVVFLAANALFSQVISSRVVSLGLALAVALGVIWLALPQGRLSIARRFGHVDIAVRDAKRLEGEEGYEEALKTLRAVAPGHAAGSLLARSHALLWNLEAFATWAEYDHVPTVVRTRFLEEVRVAREALWRSADWAATAPHQGAERSNRLDAETVRLGRFVEGIRQARLALAEVTLLALQGECSESDLRDVGERGLSQLAQATRHLGDAGGQGT